MLGLQSDHLVADSATATAPSQSLGKLGGRGTPSHLPTITPCQKYLSSKVLGVLLLTGQEIENGELWEQETQGARRASPGQD